MLNILLSMSMTFSMIFLLFNHPLAMGLILLLQTILFSLIMGLMSLSFWFSYILLLIYLGGMLVLFMYVTSLASNEMFYYSNWIMFTTFGIFGGMMVTFFMLNPNYNFNTYENLNNYLNLKYSSYHFLLKMYNYPMNNMTIMMVLYLFLTLIAVVKIIDINTGPLRQMN
uniref:NADH-ubiquinone oxidoreductase chain 6 n=1 Tax=Caliris sp. JZ-2017 TaxID=2073104 RepID=A0A343UMW8_9NEOP|nr:NADH dehydrogenase subunit 6 [Caliris sp. JZ-2017]